METTLEPTALKQTSFAQQQRHEYLSAQKAQLYNVTTSILPPVSKLSVRYMYSLAVFTT